MATFSELIRSFEKIRDYIRDFYIYGFKQRGDFSEKSSRTYDNEKRRIESYLGAHISWNYDKNGKSTFISLDSGSVFENPLYATWKAKSFTDIDIMLHFYIIDALRAEEQLSVGELTDSICETSERTFELQTIRLKCNEYVKRGILNQTKEGKTFFYSLSKDDFDEKLLLAVMFFQEVAPLGEIGGFLLDNQREKNNLFCFDHHFIVHTLEDEVLLNILGAMREEKEITCVMQSTRSNRAFKETGIPMKILQSTVTGRRYVCVYLIERRRFQTYRLDGIKSTKVGDVFLEYKERRAELEKNLPMVWGVTFGGRNRREIICMKLYIDTKKEGYVLERLYREGRGGEILELEENIYLYTKEIFDTNEISPWIKTFIGRIIQLEGTNQFVINRFYRDINRMKQIYWKEED